MSILLILNILSLANNLMINSSIKRFILEIGNEKLMFCSISREHCFEDIPGKKNKILVLMVLHLFQYSLKLIFRSVSLKHYFETVHVKENKFLVLTTLHLFIIFFSRIRLVIINNGIIHLVRTQIFREINISYPLIRTRR